MFSSSRSLSKRQRLNQVIDCLQETAEACDSDYEGPHKYSKFEVRAARKILLSPQCEKFC